MNKIQKAVEIMNALFDEKKVIVKYMFSHGIKEYGPIQLEKREGNYYLKWVNHEFPMPTIIITLEEFLFSVHLWEIIDD